MAPVTLLILAISIVLMNKSNYLKGYRVTKLPSIAFLVLALLLPLALLNFRIANWWLKSSWLLLLAVGTLSILIDWEHHLLPDRLLLPTFAVSIILIAIGGHGRASATGAGAWFSAFALLAMINPSGLGWGDVKFAGLLGADIGAIDLKMVPTAVFFALITGGCYALYRIEKGDRGTQIPFGPFMLIGTLTSLLTG